MDGWIDERMEGSGFRFPGYPAGSACSRQCVPTWYFKEACLEVDQSGKATPLKGGVRVRRMCVCVVCVDAVNGSFMK